MKSTNITGLRRFNLVAFAAVSLLVPCLVNCTASAPRDDARDVRTEESALDPNTACSMDSDCAPGQSCVNGVCTDQDAGVPACSSDADCPSGESCVDGVCTAPDGGDGGVLACSADADCPAGELCVNGICTADGGVPACSSDSDCPAGEVCIDGICGVADAGTP